MQYLVKMTPLEPYCFGTDQSAPYIGAENGGKGTYFIRSKALPEQTTLLGTLRCMILESQGLLKENFDYTPEERQQMAACIGPESFRFISEKEAEFWLYQGDFPVVYNQSGGTYLYQKSFK